jgi:hypothetical protein
MQKLNDRLALHLSCLSCASVCEQLVFTCLQPHSVDVSDAIIEQVRKLPVHVRSLPALTDLANGKVAVADIHELDRMRDDDPNNNLKMVDGFKRPSLTSDNSLSYAAPAFDKGTRRR